MQFKKKGFVAGGTQSIVGSTGVSLAMDADADKPTGTIALTGARLPEVLRHVDLLVGVDGLLEARGERFALLAWLELRLSGCGLERRALVKRHTIVAQHVEHRVLVGWHQVPADLPAEHTVLVSQNDRCDDVIDQFCHVASSHARPTAATVHWRLRGCAACRSRYMAAPTAPTVSAWVATEGITQPSSPAARSSRCTGTHR